MRYVVIVHDSHMSQRANDERMQSSTLTAETSMGSTLTRVAIDESQIISTKTRVLKSNSRYSLSVTIETTLYPAISGKYLYSLPAVCSTNRLCVCTVQAKPVYFLVLSHFIGSLRPNVLCTALSWWAFSPCRFCRSWLYETHQLD